MLTYTENILLGIIQGVTEFLPVSSSGHLVVGQYLLQVEHISLAFIAITHLGTLAAVLLYFWKDFWNMVQPKELKNPQNILWKIAIATIPAVIAGLLFGDKIESAIQGITFVAGTLFVTGVILILSEWMTKKHPNTSEATWNTLSYQNAFLIGLAQVIALIPGISRSGTTIVAGMLTGLKREDAVRFSFLMSTPAVAGAGFYSLLLLLDTPDQSFSWIGIILAFFASVLSGIITIHFFLKHIRKQTLNGYALYVIALSVLLMAITIGNN